MAVTDRLVSRRQSHLKWPAFDILYLCDFLWRCRRTRRNDHLYLTAIAEGLRGRFRTAVEILTRLVVLGVAVSFVVFGYLNFLRGFSSFRMPSLTPIASLYAAIPISGVLIALFTVEQIVNGLRNGFEHADLLEEPRHVGDIETIATKVSRS